MPLRRSLTSQLMAAVVIAIPFWIVGALFWPNATGVATTLVYVGGYVLALRLTWWLLRPRTINALRDRYLSGELSLEEFEAEVAGAPSGDRER